MSNYRRKIIPGGTYFFTQVTYQRQPWLCTDLGRNILKIAINHVRNKYPFTIEAFILLPDHFHCIWTLPENDSNYKTRFRLIKTFVTKNCGQKLNLSAEISASRYQRQESNLWQRRFWEHCIKDDLDFQRHCDYIHYNPVKHQLCKNPQDWQFSSIHRFIAEDIYSNDWGKQVINDLHYDYDE